MRLVEGGTLASRMAEFAVPAGATRADRRARQTRAAGLDAVSPDQTRLATGSDDGTVRVWDAATGTELLVLNCGNVMVEKVFFSPDGRRLATVTSDSALRVWDASPPAGGSARSGLPTGATSCIAAPVATGAVGW